METKDRSFSCSETIVMAVMVIMLPTFDGMVSKFVLMVLNLSSEVVSN